jgi:hypothetical protein
LLINFLLDKTGVKGRAANFCVLFVGEGNITVLILAGLELSIYLSSSISSLSSDCAAFIKSPFFFIIFIIYDFRFASIIY